MRKLYLVFLLVFITQISALAQPSASILVFSKTNHYTHPSIPAVEQAFQELGTEHDWNVQVTSNTDLFKENLLDQFDVIVWNNNCAFDEYILNEEEKLVFQQYIRDGGGYLGIHGTAWDNQGVWNWPWYTDLLGANERRPSHYEKVNISVEMFDEPSTKNLPATFLVDDEVYTLSRDVRSHEYSNPEDNIEVLLSGETPSFEAGLPIAWRHTFEGGRAYYLHIGHKSSTFEDSNIRTLLAGAVEWISDNSDNVKITQPFSRFISLPASENIAANALGQIQFKVGLMQNLHSNRYGQYHSIKFIRESGKWKLCPVNISR